jgi:hypothetical protein
MVIHVPRCDLAQASNDERVGEFQSHRGAFRRYGDGDGDADKAAAICMRIAQLLDEIVKSRLIGYLDCESNTARCTCRASDLSTLLRPEARHYVTSRQNRFRCTQMRLHALFVANLSVHADFTSSKKCRQLFTSRKKQ